MTERVTYFPAQPTSFCLGCPALDIKERVKVNVLEAEVDQRESERGKSGISRLISKAISRIKSKNGIKKDIVLSVRVTDLLLYPIGNMSRMAVKSEKRTPRQVLDAIGACSEPQRGRYTEVLFCPAVKVVPRQRP